MRHGALAGLVLLAAAACGREGGGPASGGAGGSTATRGAPASPAPVAPPWGDRPDDGVWDALSWAWAAPDLAVDVIDPVAVRAARPAWRRTSALRAVVEARKWWAGTVGLPDDLVRRVVEVRSPAAGGGADEDFVAVLVGASFEDAARAAAAVTSWTVAPGGRAEVRSRDGAVVAIWHEAWLLRGDDALVARALEARRTGKGFRAAPEVRLAASAVPVRPWVRVEVGREMGSLPPGMPAPRFSFTAEDRATRSGATAFPFASEASRAQARQALEATLAQMRKAGFSDAGGFDDRGTVLRAFGEDRRRPTALRRDAEEELRDLLWALRRFRDATGHFPKAAEGLAALRADPRWLDDFLGVVPDDPWGRPYHYAPHPTKPDDVDLRSAGEDGEIDTEDDVFPAD